jgi:hypothetical protein
MDQRHFKYSFYGRAFFFSSHFFLRNSQSYGLHIFKLVLSMTQCHRLNKVRVKFESLLLYRVHTTCNLCTWIFRFPFVFCDDVMEVTQNTEFTVRDKLMTKIKTQSNFLFGSNARGNRRSRIGHSRHILHKTHQARFISSNKFQTWN